MNKSKEEFELKHSKDRKRAAHAVILAAVILLGAYTVFITPQAVKSMTPKVSVIFPQNMQYTPTVSCNGTVEYSELFSLTNEMPLVVSKFTVGVGSKVDEGQTVALTDKEKTFEQLSALYGTSGLDTGSIAAAMKELPESICATSSGVVCSLANTGELIMPDTPIIQLADKSSLVLNAAVPEGLISRVKTGQSATVTASALDTSFEGTVSYISSCARKQYNGTAQETVVDITIEIENPTSELKSGFTAKGEIKTGVGQTLLTLPYSAICQDDKGEFVYVFKNGSAVRRDISTGLELAEVTQVLGVMSDEEIIDDPRDISSDCLVIKRAKEELE